MMTPYQVLGLEEGAPFDEVRRKYKDLAKLYHPDRHQKANEDERKKKEEYFKKVTVAYQVIVDELEKEDLRKNTMPTYNWGAMKEVLMNTFVDVATKYLTRKEHHISVPVTLEDTYMKKRKKLQIFLKGVEDPVIVHVVCDRCHTKVDVVTNDGEVHQINMELQVQDHSLFYIQDQEVYANVVLQWDEYIEGKSISCTFLDGTDVVIHVTPFTQPEQPFDHPSGKFKVHVSITGPSKDDWLHIDEKDRNHILNIFQKLRAVKS